MNRQLLITFSCLFLVMVGFSIALAVLPFHVDRLATGTAISTNAVALHVGAVTGVYALAQFICAPLWGRWSDRQGRRAALLTGLGGFAFSQVLFGVADTLVLLYTSRILGGVFSAAVFPIAAATVVDTLPSHHQVRGMAWLSASAALGVVAGPAFGGLLDHEVWSWMSPAGLISIDSFTIPFIALGGLSLIMLVIAARWLREVRTPAAAPSDSPSSNWFSVAIRIRGLLVLVVASQFAMALFMTAFALYAEDRLDMGPQGIGVAFALCGLITASVQAGGIWLVARRLSVISQVCVGFAAMGSGLLLLPLADSLPVVFTTIGIFVVGSALVAPSLLALIGSWSQSEAGLATGLQGSATYLGQIIGPLSAGVLFAWRDTLPFLFAAILMLATSGWLALRHRWCTYALEKETT